MGNSELKKIRQKLPRGSYKRIGEELGLTRESVIAVMYGSRNNIEVIEKALAIIEEHKERLKKVENQIKSL